MLLILKKKLSAVFNAFFKSFGLLVFIAWIQKLQHSIKHSRSPITSDFWIAKKLLLRDLSKTSATAIGAGFIILFSTHTLPCISQQMISLSALVSGLSESPNLIMTIMNNLIPTNIALSLLSLSQFQLLVPVKALGAPCCHPFGSLKIPCLIPGCFLLLSCSLIRNIPFSYCPVALIF